MQIHTSPVIYSGQEVCIYLFFIDVAVLFITTLHFGLKPVVLTRNVVARSFAVKGMGYYNLDARESYDVVIARLNAMIREQEQKKGCFLCLSMMLIGFFCCSCSQVSAIEKKIEELKDAKTIAMARRDAAGPSADMSLPAELQERLKGQRNKDSAGPSAVMFLPPELQERLNTRQRNNHSAGRGDGGVLYYDSYYTYAAACGYYGGGGGYDYGGGDGGDGAGACGGGACGAAACGGG